MPKKWAVYTAVLRRIVSKLLTMRVRIVLTERSDPNAMGEFSK